MNATAILKRATPTIILLIVILGVWQSVSWALLNVFEVPLAQSKLPYLHELAATFVTYSSTLLSQAFVTLKSSFLGFVVGGCVGVLLAIVMSSTKWIEQMSFPYIVASQMIPILGLAPIVYGIVRDDSASRIIIAAFMTFFPVVLNMLRGLKSADISSIELLHSYAAKPWTVYWKLRLPQAMPSLFTGLKIAAPLAVTGAILVELMGATEGIGVIMLRNLYYGSSHAYMFWLTVIVGALLGFISYLIVSWIERFVTPWQPEFRKVRGDE